MNVTVRNDNMNFVRNNHYLITCVDWVLENNVECYVRSNTAVYYTTKQAVGTLR